MIYEFTDRSGPKVTTHGGRIAVITGEFSEQHGFVFDRMQATGIAIKLPKAVAEASGDNLPAHDVRQVAFDAREEQDGEPVIRIVFDIEGAPMAGILSLDKFSDLAANCAAVSRKIDASFPPRRDG